MISIPELIWALVSILIVTLLARVARRQVDDLGKGPASVPYHGPTEIFTLENGRKVYVGRVGSRPWIQLPSLDQGLTHTECHGLTQALKRAAVDGMAWEAMDKAPIKKAA